METKELKIQVPEGYEIDTKKYRKDLLLKDLCARLPYDVFVKDTYIGHDGRMYKITQGCVYYVSEVNCNHRQSHPRYIKPYLRPMSSMTEEEKEELCEICTLYTNHGDASTYEFWGVEILNQSRYGTYFKDDYSAIDWLNAHHFDYRGLIEKGLALEAPEGMYNV